MTEEEKRLEEARLGIAPWRLWGPYLSERQWGTVREDYSADGKAWEYFPHDHARSRTYRWGEDGLAGISDDKQLLCFALALWNGKDPILKERLFGLTGHEGNHGEDVKEYYFYLDNTPSHAYMKYLYKYPQAAYPYVNLVEENRRRTRLDFEYELMDTGIFNDNCYYDVFVEYAKVTAEDILIQMTVTNRGLPTATLHLLPTLWFRNMWSWGLGEAKPTLTIEQQANGRQLLKASHGDLGDYWLYWEGTQPVLFTENETNKSKLFGVPNESPYVKDGIHEYIVHGQQEAINQVQNGTKAAIHYILQIDGGSTKTVQLRLSCSNALTDPFGKEFNATYLQRKAEADAFYQRITPYPLSEDMRNIQRQGFAGLLWNKQYYHYYVEEWLKGDPIGPKPPPGHQHVRNCKWWNLNAGNVFSMPDKWEYPWFAAWDLAFHTISFAMIDPEFAKKQLLLLTKEWYMHPDGQIPAYEWAFGDVNPPVHAWAAFRVYQIEQEYYGRKDRDFLEKMFQKLLLNFTWWVNRKDVGGRNIFEGGFLGLDNIGSFDRRFGPPIGGILEQPDGTGWMGMYCLNLLQIALELALDDSVYEDMATKFFEHFVYIADAINNVSGRTQGLWDEKEGFYYGLLRLLNGDRIIMEEDTLVGIVPLFAVTINHPQKRDRFPKYRERFEWFIKHRPDLLKGIGDLSRFEVDGNDLISLADSQKLSRVLSKLFDEKQFFSPYGIRSVSKRHAQSPFVLTLGDRRFTLDYEPAESTTDLFGGNSNWRGPVWFPLNYLLIESLFKFYDYFGENLKIECPIGSKNVLSLKGAALEISHRLIKIFLKDEKGRRPLYGGIEKFQNDPHWRDYILFHEYFHGDNGAGLGASNQTGWTGLVVKLIHEYGKHHAVLQAGATEAPKEDYAHKL